LQTARGKIDDLLLLLQCGLGDIKQRVYRYVDELRAA
jgi:hypothetical protein